MPVPVNWAIDVDRACATCGYNLRGLQPAGLCPECGSLVSESLGSEALEWRDEWWVKRLRAGCVLILGGQIPLVVALFSGPDQLRGRLIVISAIALCAVGAWLVSSVGRGLNHNPAYRRLRLGVRLTCVAPLAAAVAYPLLIPVSWPPCIFFTFKTLAALASRRGARSWAKFADSSHGILRAPCFCSTSSLPSRSFCGTRVSFRRLLSPWHASGRGYWPLMRVRSPC